MPYEFIDEEELSRLQANKSPRTTPQERQRRYEFLPEETMPESALRNVIGALSSGAAGFGGVPRDIADLVQSIRTRTAGLGEQFVPEEIKEAAAEAATRPYDRPAGEAIISGIQEALPTRETIKETIGAALPVGYLAPRSEYEKLGQSFASDVGTFLFPIGAPLKVKHAATIAGLGNIAEFASKKIGATPGVQEGVKLGTMLLTSFGMQPSLKQRAKEMHKRIEELAPASGEVSAKPLTKVMKDFYSDFSSKGTTSLPSKKAVNEILSGMEKSVRNDRVSIVDLLAAKEDLKEKISLLDKDSRAIDYLEKLDTTINDVIKKGSDTPKEMSSLFSAYDEIHQGMNKTNNALKFIENKIPKNISGSLAKIGLGGFGVGAAGFYGGLPGALGAGAAGAGAYGIARAGHALKHYLSNPSIRKEYAQILSAALKEATPGVIKSANKLDKEIKKIDKKLPGRYEFIETPS